MAKLDAIGDQPPLSLDPEKIQTETMDALFLGIFHERFDLGDASHEKRLDPLKVGRRNCDG